MHSKTPSFIGDKSVNLSWKEATKPSTPSTATAVGYERSPCHSLLHYIIYALLINLLVSVVNYFNLVFTLPWSVLASRCTLIIIIFSFNIVCRNKRPGNAANGSGSFPSKKGRGAGGLQNQLVNRALEGLSQGGRSGGRGRGRGWGGRGRGRGYR